MTDVTAITLTAGGAAVHVTVQSGGVDVSPGNITWTLDAVLQPVSVTADATGFNFQAPVGMPACDGAVATAINAQGGAAGQLTVEVEIDDLTFTSP